MLLKKIGVGKILNIKTVYCLCWIKGFFMFVYILHNVIHVTEQGEFSYNVKISFSFDLWVKYDLDISCEG